VAKIRYIVNDVDEAIAFYRDQLGFDVDMHPAPGFAALSRGDLTLLLNQPGAGGAGKAGGNPAPGGWARFQIEVDDLDLLVEQLSSAGVEMKGDVVEGQGGKQTLAVDPSGNLVELFQPA
jgi:catechol 2,3-dioxygenase-like lactoylglutathione lyase family enzyme